LIAGCFVAFRSTTDPGTTVNIRIVLVVGSTATVDGTDMKLGFDEVMSDSRCPADAFCVQMGEAVVQLTAENGSRAQKVRLSVPSAGGQRADVDGYSVELLQLDPYPHSGTPIDRRSYRATINVTSR
jgi:hypothetical protein